MSDRRRVTRGGRRQPDNVLRRVAVARTVAGLRASTLTSAPVVLVVDDHADGREMVAEYLRLSGFHVEEASTGWHAIEKAASIRPDVILLDLKMPDLDGWEIVARLRQNESTKSIKIVLLTAQVGADVRSRTAAAGIAMFIPKPCDLEAVVLQLAYLVYDAEAGQRAAV